MFEWNVSDAVAQAMRAVPRADFLPPDVRHYAYVDAPIPIGRGQTNSQPTTVAIMLSLLDVQPGQRVLDVGSGSGWTTALLAHLVGPEGQVLGVERQDSLIEPSRAALARYGGEHAEIHRVTPGVLGLPERAPFDRILVSAEATRLPETLVDQLDDGGIMVIPVDGTMLHVQCRDGETEVTEHGAFVFVPLIEGD